MVINLQQILDYAKIVGLFSTLLTVISIGWKIRKAFDEVIVFTNDVRSFMTDMRQVTANIRDNHLPHIESALLQIAEQTKQKDRVGL